ncbi:hypothetical protein HK101_011257 [Irineochytrium annulatum]|nr:hypothetical protein HK101_011257 [Irineochytrium annulatum]
METTSHSPTRPNNPPTRIARNRRLLFCDLILNTPAPSSGVPRTSTAPQAEFLEQHIDYFADSQMRIRDPDLFHHYVDRHVPESEKRQPFDSSMRLVDRMYADIDASAIEEASASASTELRDHQASMVVERTNRAAAARQEAGPGTSEAAERYREIEANIAMAEERDRDHDASFEEEFDSDDDAGRAAARERDVNSRANRAQYRHLLRRHYRERAGLDDFGAEGLSMMNGHGRAIGVNGSQRNGIKGQCDYTANGTNGHTSIGNNINTSTFGALPANSDTDSSLLEPMSALNLTLDERLSLRTDLLRIMRHRFISGLDAAFFDYAILDDNADFDDLEQMNRDREDAYFDAEEDEDWEVPSAQYGAGMAEDDAAFSTARDLTNICRDGRAVFSSDPPSGLAGVLGVLGVLGTHQSDCGATGQDARAEESDRMRELRATFRNLPSPSIAFPRRPTGAWNLFAGDTVRQMHASHPDVPVPKLMVYASEKWKALSDKEKKIWHKKAEDDRLRYERELQNYKANRTPRDLVIERSRKRIMDELGMKGHKVAKLATTDTEAPKRPMSGFMRFANGLRAAESEKHATMSVAEFGMMAGRLWRQMSASEKEMFNAPYEKEMAAYKKKMMAHQKENNIAREAALLKGEIGSHLKELRAKMDAPKRRMLERQKTREKIRKAKIKAADQKKRGRAAARERKKMAAAREKEKKLVAKEKAKEKAALAKEKEQKKAAAIKEKERAAKAKEMVKKKAAALKEREKASAARERQRKKAATAREKARAAEKKSKAALKPKATKVTKVTPKKRTGKVSDGARAKALAASEAELAQKATKTVRAALTKTQPNKAPVARVSVGKAVKVTKVSTPKANLVGAATPTKKVTSDGKATKAAVVKAATKADGEMTGRTRKAGTTKKASGGSSGKK